MPDICVVCGNTKSKDHSVSFHRFPKDPMKRSKWIGCLKLKESCVKDHHRVCSRHFPSGDATNNDPSLVLGKKFASLMKHWSARSKRAKARSLNVLFRNASASKSPSPTVGPNSPPISTPNESESLSSTSMTDVTACGRSVCSSPIDDLTYSDDGDRSESSSVSVSESTSSLVYTGLNTRSGRNAEVMVSTALLARVELLEAKNKTLKEEVSRSQTTKQEPLSVQGIASKQDLIKLYTGFPSYEVFLAFYEFLGPSVKKLNYWGEKQSKKKRRGRRKVESIDQCLLTLMKLN